MSSFAITYLNALQYQWLVFLTVIDDYILAAENTVERVFPPSKHVFNKIDDIVQVTETFPMKYEKAVTTFPTIIHQFPFLDWLLLHIISMLKLLITTLTYWGSQGTREKEIVVVVNCKNHDNDQFVSMNVYDHTTKSHVDSENNTIKGEFLCHVPETPPKVETQMASAKVEENDLKSTYKEVLEKNATNDDKEHGKKVINVTKAGRKKSTNKKIDKKDDDRNKGDPILDLFESGWQMRR